MYAGVDIGSSCLKMVIGDGEALPQYSSRDFDINKDGLVTDEELRQVSHTLVAREVTSVSLTGTGARRLSRIVRMNSDIFVLCPEGDVLSHEITLQTQGVRQMLRERGDVYEEFMLVAIGTGTSFTRVSDGSVRLFEPGLSVGGRFLSNNAASLGIATQDIERYAKAGKDGDLLMKHVDPTIRFPKSEFVVASMGRLGNGIEFTPENAIAGFVKTVATLIIGHLLSIQVAPDWKWRGPVVFIGTPVAKCEPLRDWLHLFSTGIGHRALFLDKGNYAGALAAYHEALGTRLRIQGLPRVRGPIARFFRWLAYQGKALSLAVRARRKSK